MRICVLGLGHIGLPTTVVLASAGNTVIGVDTDPQVVARLERGVCHPEEPQLVEALGAALNTGRLEFRGAPVPADAFIIAVPTPVLHDKTADLRYVAAAAESILPALQPGNIVILESTVPPFTTESLLLPILEKCGLRAGEDIFVAYSPERVLPGRVLAELVANHRVIGGINTRSGELAREVYLSFVKGEIHLTNTATAEMVKLMENAYRDVNIALANEFAMLAQEMGIDAWEAIRIANQHPRVQIHQPGPGVGGHCIAVDPWFLVQLCARHVSLMRTARLINDAMPLQVMGMLKSVLEPGRRPISVLGVAYKGNVGDTRESPALEVIRQARHLGYEVRIHDPHVNKLDCLGTLLPVDEAVGGAEALLVLTDHDEFQCLDVPRIASLVARKVLIDTRNCLNHAVWQEHGFRVLVLGRGTR